MVENNAFNWSCNSLACNQTVSCLQREAGTYSCECDTGFIGSSCINSTLFDTTSSSADFHGKIEANN